MEAPGCTDETLLNDWHVIATSAAIIAGQMHAGTLLERDLVAWRDAAGALHVWKDFCVHRDARLSIRRIFRSCIPA